MTAPDRAPVPGRRLAERLLSRLLDERDRDDVLGELDEIHRERSRTRGRMRATARYGWEVARYAWVLALHGSEFRTESGRLIVPRPRVGVGFVQELAGDVRLAMRGFAKRPSVALVVVATVALAVGANTAVFSVGDALLLRPLSVRDPDRLVSLLHVQGGGYSEFSRPDFDDLRAWTRSLAGIAAYTAISVDVGEGEDIESVEGLLVSGNYLDVLGVAPRLGRWFLPEEDVTEGTHLVAVVSTSLWRRRMGSDPGVVGSTLLVNGAPFTVVGVAPEPTPTPDFSAAPEIWVPLATQRVTFPGFHAFGTDLYHNRGTHWLQLLGRLAPGVERTSAGDELRALAARQAEENPETNTDWSIVALPAARLRAGPPGTNKLVRLTLLMGSVVGLVLLIACANVANLLLSRAISRRDEMAVRLALGAGRARLVRQMLVEALALSVGGSVLGVAVAFWSKELLTAVGVTASLPGLTVRIDGRVLAFAAALSVLTGVAFGILPAVRGSSVSGVRSGGGGSGGSTADRTHLRQLLIVVQVALSLVLVVGAGLALRTLGNLRSVPLGFDTSARVVGVDMSDAGLSVERARDVEHEVVRQVRELPGVAAAGYATIPPFSGRRMANDVLWQGPDGGEDLLRTNVDMNVVGPGYFDALGIELLRGRVFTEEDVAGGIAVAVINDAMAERLWPGENAVGRTILSWNPEGRHDPLQVVGVVANGRYYRSWRAADRPFVFLPLSQNPSSAVSLHVRAAGAGAPTDEELRRVVTAVDAAIERSEVRAVLDARDEALSLERASARLLSLFGALALTIAAVGIYGALSFTVSERTREIGVRMALGASTRDVYRNVLGGSLRPLLAGVAVGWLVALAASRMLGALLFGVSRYDPLTYAMVAVVLVASGVVASLVPARRATRVDPLPSLRP